jgi:hypothetical protein
LAGSLRVQSTLNNQLTYRKILKKFQIKTILKIPCHVALDRLDIWFQDEVRFGKQNTTTKIWAEKGTRPRVVQQQQYTYAYLFGAVCPTDGKTEAIIAPFSNMEIMKEHLVLIASATEVARHAIVIIPNEFNS